MCKQGASEGRRRRGILRRGSRRFRTKHKPGPSTSSSSSSESTLVNLLSSTSLTRTSSRWSHISKEEPVTTTSTSESDVTLQTINKKLQGEKENREQKASVEPPRKGGQIGKLGDLPFDPILRAGILIVVTSPKGDVSLGMCDGESPPMRTDEKAMGTASRSSRRMKLLRSDRYH